MTVANILDPVHSALDPEVWDHPDAPEPKLKEHHRLWIVNAVTRTLEKAGYSHADQWLSLVLTGSLTTYQYGPDSDVDVSLFVDVEHFPEWSRAEMIGVMVEGLDGKRLPGTTHPMQAFVVPGSITKDALYQPGLRSGYDLYHKRWLVPPEKDRVKDVEKEMNAAYIYAQECADKMERLLKYDPDKAIFYWHMLHKARQRDQRAGKGDFALSNVVYKFLAKKGLLPEISEVSGEYIAKEAWTTLPDKDMYGEHIVVPDVGDHANGSIVVEVDNLTTHLEDGRILPGEEVVKTASEHDCPECRGTTLDPYGEECAKCHGLGYISPSKFFTPGPRPVPIPEPNWFQHPDPFMDNEPGTLTLPKHWGKTAGHMVDPRAIDKAQHLLGLKHPVKVTQVPKAINLDGQPYSALYRGLHNGVHHVNITGWLSPETASGLLWHELVHAQQYERDPAAWHTGLEEYDKTRQQGYDAYMNHPDEQEARAAATPFPLALNKPTQRPVHGNIPIKDQWSFEEEAGE
jgi:hypothetical protein